MKKLCGTPIYIKFKRSFGIFPEIYFEYLIIDMDQILFGTIVMNIDMCISMFFFVFSNLSRRISCFNFVWLVLKYIRLIHEYLSSTFDGNPIEKFQRIMSSLL